jgi:DNA-binding GntR family transcriptional regulator
VADDARSIADDIATRIAGAIVAGEFEPGTWLRQEALAERYGVSRQPVRDALRQVQVQHLVELHPHRGALVRRPSSRDIRDSYLVRAELEGLAASLAARRITVDEFERLKATQQEFERITTEAADAAAEDAEIDEAWGQANEAFHDVIMRAAGVEVLRETVAGLHLMIPRPLMRRTLRARRLLEQNVGQHRDVMEAIEAGDEATARHAMREHIMSSVELIAERFDGD